MLLLHCDDHVHDRVLSLYPALSTRIRDMVGNKMLLRPRQPAAEIVVEDFETLLHPKMHTSFGFPVASFLQRAVHLRCTVVRLFAFSSCKRHLVRR
jgi:hypothetical protein